MIPEDRMSTALVDAAWIPPDGFDRTMMNDYELGPIALNDTSQGMMYQNWELTWSGITNNFTVTPALVGTPQVVLNVANVTQCSLSFDQNGHVSIAYTAGGAAYLYWYDTLVASWVITALGAGVTAPMVCLDDKRASQSPLNDIILWYTKQELSGAWSLYRKLQRERFLNEKKMLNGTALPFIRKCGMHSGLRIKIMMTYVNS